MALDRKAIADRLRKAREQLGFTQADVAEALGVHRPTVSEIEAGRRAVTSEELHRMSELFAIPVGTLLSERGPSESDIERVLFRTASLEAPAARAAIRRFMERCRAEKELEEMLGVPRPDDARPGYRASFPRSKPDAIRQGNRIAEQERHRLELGTEPLRNPLELLERQGVRIGPLEGLDDRAPDGIYFETDELGPCVAVNPERDQWTGFRSAFTAAHEYAHWLLRDQQVEEYDFLESSDDLGEVRANVFAAAFLMPEEGLKEYFSEAGLVEDDEIRHLSPGDVVRAMDYFGVSRQALLYRLQNVRLIDEERAGELRDADFSVMRIAETLGIDFRVRRNFGTRLPALAVEAWRRGLITTGRAAELCGTEIEEFRAAMRELGEEPELDAGDVELGAAAPS